MSDGQIVVSSLTKVYKTVRAVDDLSFTVAPGRVTGFLGPNGAGKTTTLRMLLNLVGPTSGTATIGGSRYADLKDPLRHVGAVLEASSAHKGRTGINTLRVSCAAAGFPAKRADEVMELVGLSAAAKRKFKGYSLGMKQRLGIAYALLGDPHVLILDEPANGLDPEGIRWMRDLLRGYADRGGTVLLSSHLLHEIEVIADDLVVIGKGRIVARGTKADLLAAAGTVVRARDAVALATAMERAGLTVTVHADGSVHTDATADQVGEVALAARLVLTELRAADGAGLEEMF